MSKCILVRVRNRVTGSEKFVGGYHTEQALRSAYPKVDGQPDPLLHENLPGDSAASDCEVRFEEFLEDGEQTTINDPR